MTETIVQMKDRHWKEEEQLRKNCEHQMKNLIKKTDCSSIGCGAYYPRRDIICKLCGIKKMIFDEPSWKGIKKTIQKTGLKDERFSFISHDHELEEAV